jgi:hypothetical protein
MAKKEFKFENGVEVTEKVTGFTGIITGTAFYLTGCAQHLVTAKTKDEFSEAVSNWYDDGRLEYKGPGITAKEVESEDNGCDKPAPKK